MKTRTDLSSCYIFVVDDDVDDQLLLQEAFTEHAPQAELLFFPDGHQLLSALERIPPQSEALPDLIITDFNMPQLTGHEVITRLKKHPSLHHIPVVLLSTSNDPETHQRSLQLGAVASWVKPIRSEEVLPTVQRLLEVAC